MGDVPHKSPGNKAPVSPNSDTQKESFRCLCICLVSWTWGLMTSSAMMSAWTPLSRVLAGNRMNPVCPSTGGNLYCELYWFRKLYCNLYWASQCVQCKKIGLLNSNTSCLKLSIQMTTVPHLQYFPLGMQPKKLHVHSCYMDETSDPKSESNSRKRGRNSASNTLLFQIGIWHQLS